MSKFVHISKSKYRVVTSDILPYERPIFFSNRFFARFLKYYGIHIEQEELVATKNHTEGLDDFLKLLGGMKGSARRSFQYDISRGSSEKKRTLTIIHPYYQVELVEFYEQYKMLLIDFCNRSDFSLRYPYKIADKQKQVKGYAKLISDTQKKIDTDSGLKHFFSYRRCDNINDFYDGHVFLQAEKQFTHMLKLDLEECFDSIVPSDLSVATLGRLNNECMGSFASRFADIQSHLTTNHNKGIVIGPEFSRIYAEMILQRIDLLMEQRMRNEGLYQGKDYQFYRYVDDGFLFYNDEKSRKCWEKYYGEVLEQFSLRVNAKKIITYESRPFVDVRTEAKIQISQLIDEMFTNRLTTFKGFMKVQGGDYDTPTFINYEKFVKTLRVTIRNGVEYKDVTSFCLGLIKSRLVKLFRQFDDVYREYVFAEIHNTLDEKGKNIKKKYEREYIEYLQEIARILFFILSCDMRMVTSIKVVSIINFMQLYIRGYYCFDNGLYSCKFPRIAIYTLDETITSETKTLLRMRASDEDIMMEMLNVLELQKVMTTGSCIREDDLMQYLSIQDSEAFSKRLNFFIVFELLHFTNHFSEGYDELKDSLHHWVLEKTKELKEPQISNTEAVLTCIEFLCDPQGDTNIKNAVLRNVVNKKERRNSILQFVRKQKDLFIKWRGYKIDYEILQFENNDVY